MLEGILIGDRFSHRLIGLINCQYDSGRYVLFSRLFNKLIFLFSSSRLNFQTQNLKKLDFEQSEEI